MDELTERILLEQAKETYEARIKIQLTSEPSGKVELANNEAVIGFDIEIEYRSWGIKEIVIQPKGSLTVDYIAGEEDANTINVDVEDAVIEWERGYESIRPLWMDIRMDENGNVTEKTLHVSSR